MCSVIISFGSLFKDIVPDCFSDDEWLDLFLVMPLVEEYLVGEFRDILKKSDDTIKDEYIEELLVKMNGLTRPQWIMMKEANYRYWTARKGGLGASDSLDFVFHGNRN